MNFRFTKKRINLMVNGDPVVYLKRWYEQYRWQSTRLKVRYVKKIFFDG